MHVCVLVTKSCTILCDPMDCSLPGSSAHGIPQARILEWVPCPSNLYIRSNPMSWCRVQGQLGTQTGVRARLINRWRNGPWWRKMPRPMQEPLPPTTTGFQYMEWFGAICKLCNTSWKKGQAVMFEGPSLSPGSTQGPSAINRQHHCSLRAYVLGQLGGDREYKWTEQFQIKC